MGRTIALAALAAVLITCGPRVLRAQDAPASADPAPDASASPAASPSSANPPGSETALSPGGEATQPVPGVPAVDGTAASPAAPAASPSAKPVSITAKPGSMLVREGDVVAGRSQDGKVRVMKVLKINFVDGDRLLHCLVYKETFHSWAEAQAAHDSHKLNVLILQIPVDGEGMTADANRVLANEPVTPKEFEGYKQYLRDTGQPVGP